MAKIAEELEKFKNGEIKAEYLYDSLRWSCKEVQETLVERGRWNTLYEWIVQDEENRLWKFSRYMGSTECQENEEFDGEVEEVESYEKVVVDYRPVTNNNVKKHEAVMPAIETTGGKNE